MSLRPYLYCMDDPINRIDPSGEIWGFLATAHTRGEDTAASYGALAWAKQKLYLGATIANATFRGYFNMLTGPESISDAAKFQIGFISGALEMQIGLRVGAAAGGAAGGAVTSTLNAAFSERGIFNMDAAARITIDTLSGLALGGVAQYADVQGKEALLMWLAGLDRDLLMWDIDQFLEHWAK